MGSPSSPWLIEDPDPGLVSKLSQSLEIRKATATCLVNRGIVDEDQANTFLNPRLQDLYKPIPEDELAVAAARLADAVMSKEQVGVFGDYDVDGMTSAAVVTSFLRLLGGRVEAEIANRFTGYGMSLEAVDRFAAKGCSLIIAVDLGTSDLAAARHAKQAGIDLVIIDHHAVEGEHPEAFAFVNPQRKDSTFEEKSLAAVGLAFYFVATTRSLLVERGYLEKDALDVKPLLDLVALGTVADVMPLKGNNRILVSHGLRYLSRSNRKGLRQLIRVARIRTSEIRSEHIAFQIAPRLNAAGRLGHAEEAFALLMANEREGAERLALRLDGHSQERKALETAVISAARDQIDEGGLDRDPILFVAGDDWHRGVLGIVASRLVEEYHKPAFVIGIDGNEGIGSVRGRGQINMHDALLDAAPLLRRFGGHMDAAGFTVLREQIEELKARLVAYALRHGEEVPSETLTCDVTLAAAELGDDLLQEISRLGPFGSGNPEPVFDIDGLYILEQRVIGQDHLKLDLKTPSGHISAFGPRMARLAGTLPPLIRTAANICPDEWRGKGFIELKLAAPPVPGS